MRFLEGRDLKIWDVDTLAERADLIGWVSSCGIAPDGTFIVSGSSGEFVGRRKYFKIWDPATGHELARRPTRRAERSNSWVIGPDKTFMVSADEDGTIKIWDVPLVPNDRGWREPQTIISGKRGRTPGALYAPTRRIAPCAIFPDGSLIVSASDEKALRIFETATGKERAVLIGHTGTVTCCAVSPDGEYVVSGGTDRTINLWAAIPVDDEIRTFHADRVNRCAAPLHGRTIVSASDDGNIKTWDVASGKVTSTIGSNEGPVTCCTVSRDGTFVVSSKHQKSGWDCLTVWNVSDWTERATLWGFQIRTYGCAISDDAQFIVSAHDTELRIWDAPTRNTRWPQRKRAVLRGHVGNPAVPGTAVAMGVIIAFNAIKTFAISPDGTFIISGGDDGSVRVWDVPRNRQWGSQKARAVLLGHTGVISCCAISPDGAYIVSGGWDARLNMWDMATGARGELRGHRDRVTCCAISPDAAFIVSGSWDRTIAIWDSATGQLLTSLQGHRDRVTCCAISSDGAFIVSGSDDKTIRIWESESGAELATLFLPGTPTCLEIVSSHPLVASGDSGGAVCLMELV